MAKPERDETIDPWTPIDGRCNEPKTRGEGLCRNEAGKRTDHLGFGACYLHRGRTPSGRAHAQKIREAQLLGPLLEAERDRIGEHPDPFEGMLELVRTGWAWVRMLEARAAELEDDQGGLFVEGDKPGDAKPHVIVAMLIEARREHRRNCDVAIRAGIAERMVALAEDQAEAMALLIRGVLEDLGHQLEDPNVEGVVRRHLRALPGGAAA